MAGIRKRRPPVLASGVVTVQAKAEIGLDVMVIESVRAGPMGNPSSTTRHHRSVHYLREHLSTAALGGLGPGLPPGDTGFSPFPARPLGSVWQ
jgi:hypothetical protein